jgi:hypothetical protein
MLPELAMMTAEPVDTVLAMPVVLMVATVIPEELQVTEEVRSCVPPLVSAPIAVNCWVWPSGTEGLAGVTLMETKAAAVTVSVVLPEAPPETALIVVEPAPPLLAKPAMLMVATVVTEELHVTEEVRFCVLPSVYVPVAANCWVLPGGIVALAGVTTIEVSCGGVTVSVVLPEMLPEMAMMIVEPVPTLLAKPAVLMVATVVTEEFHVAEEVRFCVLPSMYVPVATNCWVLPGGIEGVAGVTVIDASAATAPIPVRLKTLGLPKAL